MRAKIFNTPSAWAWAAWFCLVMLTGGCTGNLFLPAVNNGNSAGETAYRGTEIPPFDSTYFGELSGPAQDLALEIARGLRDDPSLNRVALTTFVDVNDLNRTSAFGRALTDALMACLHRQGFEVVELRRAGNLAVKPGQGEFYLTRELVHLAVTQDLTAALVGTYTEALNTLLISARLISVRDGQVLSTALMELPKSRNLAFLLNGQAWGGSSQAQNYRRGPAIPAARVRVLERKP